MFTYGMDRVREVVRITGLAVRNSDGLKLRRKFRLVHYAASGQFMDSVRKTDIVANIGGRREFFARS